MVFLYQVTITAFRSICQDSPPPPDIQDRVIQREDDTPETSLGADDWGLPHFFFPVKPGENHEKSIENMGFRWIWMDLGRPNFDTTPCVWSSSGMFHIFVRKLGLSREDSPKVGDLPPGWPKSCHQLAKILYVFILVGGLEHGFYFPYIRNNHPNWLIFSEG